MYKTLSRLKIPQRQERKIGEYIIQQNLVLPKEFGSPDMPKSAGAGSAGFACCHTVKRIFLSAVVASGFKIFILIVDKQGRRIQDNPENFAIVLAELLNEIFLWFNGVKLNLIVDRHFSNKTDEQKLDALLKRNLNHHAELFFVQVIENRKTDQKHFISVFPIENSNKIKKTSR